MNWFQLLLSLIFAKIVFSEVVLEVHLCKTCAFGDYHMVNSFLLESSVSKAMNITNKNECNDRLMPLVRCLGNCVEIHVSLERYGGAMIGSILGCSADFIAKDPNAPPRHDYVSSRDVVVLNRTV